MQGLDALCTSLPPSLCPSLPSFLPSFVKYPKAGGLNLFDQPLRFLEHIISAFSKSDLKGVKKNGSDYYS